MSRYTPEKVYAVYFEEKEAIRHAVMLSRDLRRPLVVVWSPVADRECYRLTDPDWRESTTWGVNWACIGRADPDRGWRGGSP